MEQIPACLPSSSIGLGVLCFWERRIELGIVGSIPIALRIFLFAIYNMFSFNGMHFQLVSLRFIILRMCMFFATSFICRFEFIIILPLCLFQDFPPDYSYEVCSQRSTNVKCTFKIHENDTESGVLAWLVEYEDISKTTWRNRGKTQDPCRFTVFRVRF